MSKTKVKKVIDLVENGGKSVSAAMRAVGYSPKYAKNPDKLTNSKQWKEIIEEYLPEKDIALKHKELLNACEIQHYIFPKTGKKKLTDLEIKNIVESVAGCRLIYIKRDAVGSWAFFEAPDNNTRDKAIDKAYKLYGKYKTDDSAPPSSSTINIFLQKNEKIIQIVDSAREKLKEAIQKNGMDS